MAAVKALSMQACLIISVNTSTTLVCTSFKDSYPINCHLVQAPTRKRTGPYDWVHADLEPLKEYIKHESHVAGMCLLSQWTSSFPLASRDVLIGIQFECCKSVS